MRSATINEVYYCTTYYRLSFTFSPARLGSKSKR